MAGNIPGKANLLKSEVHNILFGLGSNNPTAQPNQKQFSYTDLVKTPKKQIAGQEKTSETSALQTTAQSNKVPLQTAVKPPQPPKRCPSRQTITLTNSMFGRPSRTFPLYSEDELGIPMKIQSMLIKSSNDDDYETGPAQTRKATEFCWKETLEGIANWEEKMAREFQNMNNYLASTRSDSHDHAENTSQASESPTLETKDSKESPSSPPS